MLNPIPRSRVYEIGYGYEYQCLKVDHHSSSNVVFLGSQFYLLPGPGPSLGKKVIHQDPSLIKLLSSQRQILLQKKHVDRGSASKNVEFSPSNIWQVLTS